MEHTEATHKPNYLFIGGYMENVFEQEFEKTQVLKNYLRKYGPSTGLDDLELKWGKLDGKSERLTVFANNLPDGQILYLYFTQLAVKSAFYSEVLKECTPRGIQHDRCSFSKNFNASFGKTLDSMTNLVFQLKPLVQKYSGVNSGSTERLHNIIRECLRTNLGLNADSKLSLKMKGNKGFGVHCYYDINPIEDTISSSLGYKIEIDNKPKLVEILDIEKAFNNLLGRSLMLQNLKYLHNKDNKEDLRVYFESSGGLKIKNIPCDVSVIRSSKEIRNLLETSDANSFIRHANGQIEIISEIDVAIRDYFTVMGNTIINSVIYDPYYSPLTMMVSTNGNMPFGMPYENHMFEINISGSDSTSCLIENFGSLRRKFTENNSFAVYELHSKNRGTYRYSDSVLDDYKMIIRGLIYEHE